MANQGLSKSLRSIGISQAHKAILGKQISVTQLCREALDVLDSYRNLNAFVTVCKDEALEKAKELDQNLSRESCIRSPLYGMPISIKDNFCTKDILTSCGSKMLADFVPPYTATVVKKLQDANSIMVGKTNMDEFAMGSSSTTSYYGPTANYWINDSLLKDETPKQANPSHWYMAGGSSTGSAVSVACGSSFASIGTDTGGSTRQPASLTGTVGFKPSYGLISRFGLVPLAHWLDVVSILTRNVEDAKLIFDTIVGMDENDLTTVDHRKLLKENFESPSTIRVGIPSQFVERSDSLSEEVSARYQEVINFLNKSTTDSDIKFEVINLDLKQSNIATECYTIIASAEISSNMSCYDGVKYGYSTTPERQNFDRDAFFKRNRDEAFGFEVKKRILLGNYFLLSGNREKYLTQALKLRRLISDEFDKVFDGEKRVDVILMPSTPTTSVSHEEWLQKQDDNKLFREDYFLIPSNLANLPSISLPSGLSPQGLPIGLQLVAKRYNDLGLLKLSQLFEIHVLSKFK